MLLSELISELQDHLEEFGDMQCTFNRSLNDILDSWTSNAEIYIAMDDRLDYDEFVLKIEGI